MKKVININFQGRVTPIEEVAYEQLQQYTASLRNYFANEEGRDEIINDIEGRIAELFAEVLKKGNPCITEDDVQAIINSIGRPEDFDGEEAKVQSQLTSTPPQSKAEQGGQNFSANGSRKLFRDENNKVLGGVCSGLANYFNVDSLIIRILFVIFIGVLFLPYIILWVAVPSSATKSIGAARKRLMRDPDNKIISGVCGGLAQYFGVNVWIPRIIFLVPFISIAFGWNHWGDFDFPNLVNLTFRPGITLLYIILWLVLPEAKTTTDKLEMKGEKVDLNSIKNTITEEMKGVGERVGKFGAEAGQVIGEKGAEMSREISGAARRTGSGLGNAIGLIVKVFAYFILAVVLFAIVTGLFAAGVTLTGLLPLKGYILNDGWQSIFAWGTLLLFIWVPVISIITFIIRRITKSKANSNTIRYTFVSLWILGLFCLIGLMSSVTDDFSSNNNPVEKEVYLNNPDVAKLEIRNQKPYKYYNTPRWLNIEPFAGVDGDTVFVPNVRLRIVKSENDSFSVKMVALANSSSRENANALASKINFGVTQRDTVLMLDQGIAITKQEKFRNQQVIITVAVPVGKRIKVNNNVDWWNNVHIGFEHDGWYWNSNDDEAEHWDRDVEYVMTTTGLKSLNPEKNDVDEYLEEEHRSDEDRRQQLQELEDKQKELDQQKKDLQKSLQEDSSRYRYKEEPAAPEVKPVVKEAETISFPSDSEKKQDAEISHDASSPLTKRFTM